MISCETCGCAIQKGEEREYKGRTICEDCYMIVLSPATFCDPWASFHASSFAAKNKTMPLTDHQQVILDTIRKERGMTADALMESMKHRISPEDGEKACAALNRMELISITRENGIIMIRTKA